MIDRGPVYIAKDRESLAGTMSELANRRYNNCANRAYYACYQAAIHALVEAGIQPPKGTDKWGHGFVQARFNGDLKNCRKRYPPSLRGALETNYRLRETADYDRRDPVDRNPPFGRCGALKHSSPPWQRQENASNERQQRIQHRESGRADASGHPGTATHDH